MSDLIRRSDAIGNIELLFDDISDIQDEHKLKEIRAYNLGVWASLNSIKHHVPSADRPQGWIPCSERLPEDIRPVLVTWKNTDPASYYQYIVGKHFIGTAHYCKGKWYWYSSATEDLLAEYGKCESEEFDEAIETVAWMPLPEPWKGADDYERAIEQMEHDMLYEPTYNSEDGSM